MRLAACALSAVLLSGCSWLGSGGSNSGSYGYNNSGVYNGCMPNMGSANYANTNYGYSAGNGCAPGAGYGVSYGGAGGYGMQGPGGMYGQGAYGAGSGAYGMGAGGMGAGTYGAGTGAYGTGAGAGGMGLRGQYGVNGYGTGLQGSGLYGTGATGVMGGGAYGTSGYGMGANGVTMLGSAAPYGAALGGAGSVMTTADGGTIRTVQGAPVYVAQPYPAYYAAQTGGGYNYGGGYSYGGYGYGYGGAMPFGLEIGGGTEFDLGGDIFPGEVSKPFNGGPGVVSDLAPISYDDAFSQAKTLNATATYDISPSTTLLANVGYLKAEGESVHIGTVSDGAGLTEDLHAEFGDLEQVRLEGGIRQYMGAPSAFRPYVGATAGFVNTSDVTLTQSSNTLVDPNLYVQNYVDGGWTPTASGVIGAEYAVGNRAAIGVESGIRWSDDLDSNFISEDRWSVPVKLRGRVSF